MSRLSIFVLLVIAPVAAMLLALLGLETLPVNPMGAFLLLAGTTYTAGVVIVYWIRKERFWESLVGGTITRQEHGSRSFSVMLCGMVAAFYLPPLEYLYAPTILPRSVPMQAAGMGLVFLGALLFIWARQSLGSSYSGHISVTDEQSLVQRGPYRLIRHPAYTGHFLMAAGLSLGYSSLAGFTAIVILLLPGLIYRMNIEERLLIAHFGDAYRQYIRATKRLVPGLW